MTTLQQLRNGNGTVCDGDNEVATVRFRVVPNGIDPMNPTVLIKVVTGRLNARSDALVLKTEHGHELPFLARDPTATGWSYRILPTDDWPEILVDPLAEDPQ